MQKKIIQTNKAPAAIGAYSQAVRVDTSANQREMIYLSGQIPLVAKTMTLVSQEIEEQIQQVFENLSAVCKAAGCELDDIVKLNIYLIDLSHFVLVNKMMEKYFKKPYPARATIGVKALPKDAKIEIDAIAIATKN